MEQLPDELGEELPGVGEGGHWFSFPEVEELRGAATEVAAPGGWGQPALRL